jgi:hypothetical protein
MHFGHHDRPDDGHRDGGRTGDDNPVPVDRTLEEAIQDVEVAVDAHLSAPSTGHRNDLVAALGRLDQLTSLGDIYQSRIMSSGLMGTALPSTVLGARSDAPMAEDIPRSEMQAQIALVRAAKDECAGGGSATQSALRDAVSRLAEAREHGPDTGPPGMPPPSDPPDPAEDAAASGDA